MIFHSFCAEKFALCESLISSHCSRACVDGRAPKTLIRKVNALLRDFMAPKSSAGKEKLVNEEDEVLQAVLLADSFDSRFKPLTTGKPRVRARTP